MRLVRVGAAALRRNPAPGQGSGRRIAAAARRRLRAGLWAAAGAGRAGLRRAPGEPPVTPGCAGCVRWVAPRRPPPPASPREPRSPHVGGGNPGVSAPGSSMTAKVAGGHRDHGVLLEIVTPRAGRGRARRYPRPGGAPSGKARTAPGPPRFRGDPQPAPAGPAASAHPRRKSACQPGPAADRSASGPGPAQRESAPCTRRCRPRYGLALCGLLPVELGAEEGRLVLGGRARRPPSQPCAANSFFCAPSANRLGQPRPFDVVGEVTATGCPAAPNSPRP